MPLVIGDTERVILAQLRERAEAAPIDGHGALEQIKTDAGRAVHVARMVGLSARLPVDVLVFFSVEHGHPGGPARHLSISVSRKERIPHPNMIWMVAELLGFGGSGVEACDMVWPEQVPGRGPAVNLIQFVTTADAAKGPRH